MALLSEIAGRRMRLPAPETRSIRVERDLPATMDDGAVLLADRHVADVPGADRGRPTVMVRSPYGRRGPFGFMFGRLFAERGFNAVVQSVRGTFGSGGTFNPFDERADGLATLRWLERQPWFDGRVGMVGPSYLGLTQWAVARDPALGALSPSITASQFHGQSFGDAGAFSLENAVSWMVQIAVQERPLALAHMMRGFRRVGKVAASLPVGDLDTLATGGRVDFYAEWLANTSFDTPYWAARDFRNGIEDVKAPVQLLGGWFDIFLPGLLQDFTALQDAGRSPQLIVGPWAHTSAGAATWSLRGGIAWLRKHLMDDDRLLDPSPVRLFVGGAAREWRSYETWPPPGIRPWTLRLASRGRLLEGADGGSGSDRYRYDPADPTPSVGGPVLLEREPVVDNRRLEAREDVLTYTTSPLEEPVEAIGPVSVAIHARSSLDTFDVFARVCDVSPDGVSRNVCDALARVGGGDREFPRAEDGTYRVEFPLWPTAHRFAAGHRIRLQVSSGAHPRYARNTGTGEDPVTSTRLVASEQEIRHGDEYPSSVTLSVLGSASAP